jgi:high-affinity K+ transport system ATPase subunit B
MSVQQHVELHLLLAVHRGICCLMPTTETALLAHMMAASMLLLMTQCVVAC